LEQTKSIPAIETLNYKVLRHVTLVLVLCLALISLYLFYLISTKWENRINNYLDGVLIGYFAWLSFAFIIFKLGVYKLTPYGIENQLVFGLFKKKLPYSKIILIHNTAKNEVSLCDVNGKLITVFYKNYIANLDEIIRYLNGRLSIHGDVKLMPSNQICITVLLFLIFIRILISSYFLG
jgi:hypothetical protein